jgi:hypothetical protein
MCCYGHGARVDGREKRKWDNGLTDDSELAREKMWSRIYLVPALTAEEDRDLVRRQLADQAREKQLFGSVTSAYNSDRYDRRIPGDSSSHVFVTSIELEFRV